MPADSKQAPKPLMLFYIMMRAPSVMVLKAQQHHRQLSSIPAIVGQVEQARSGQGRIPTGQGMIMNLAGQGRGSLALWNMA